VLVGPSEPGEVARLLRARPPGDARVEHRGFVDTGTLAALYRTSLAVVLPSVHEGFGLSVLEALCAGVPVVSSDIASTREIARDAALYVTRPFDTHCWTEALGRLCFDEPLRARLCAAGGAVAEIHTWNEVAMRFADLLIETVAGKGASSSPPLKRGGRANAPAVHS
jgi:glycosyltransferase involved in cell wall biosynthesis